MGVVSCRRILIGLFSAIALSIATAALAQLGQEQGPRPRMREGESKEYFDRFSPNGYAVGVNIIIYAMTH